MGKQFVVSVSSLKKLQSLAPTWWSPTRLHGFLSTVSSMLFWSESSLKELSETRLEFRPLSKLKRNDISLLSLMPSSCMYSESSSMLLDFPEIIFSRTSFVVADSILWLVHRDDNKSEYNYVDAQLQLTLIFTVGSEIYWLHCKCSFIFITIRTNCKWPIFNGKQTSIYNNWLA